MHVMGAIRAVATSNACSPTNQIAAIECIREASKVIAETSTKDFVAISRDLLGILAQQSVPAEVCTYTMWHGLEEWQGVLRAAVFSLTLRLHKHAFAPCRRWCLRLGPTSFHS